MKNKGAEWILYKSSQKAKDNQYDRKPPAQVEDETIPAQNIVMLNPNEDNRAFTFPTIELSLLTALNLCSNAYQSQKQQFNASRELDFLVDLALLRARRRDDGASYLMWKQERKSSSTNQKEETASSESSRGSWSTAPEGRACFEGRSVEFFRRGQVQGYKLGLELGTLIGETRQLSRNQNALLRTIMNKKVRSRSFTKIIITALQMALAKTQIEKTKKITSKPVRIPQNITVEEPREDEDDWAEMNHWWQHLPESYIR